MQILQSLDPALLPYIAVGCALLCAALIVLGFVLHALSGIFELAFGALQLAVELLQGGPVAWCGCALLLLALAAGAGGLYLLLNAPSSCAEYATQFCLWFGFLS